MRIRFLLFLFVLPICAAAQQDNYPYYQQNAVIVAPSYDCYHQNLDAGLAAKRRGDCTTALKYFQSALDCEEVTGNTRWINELEALILQCRGAARNNNIIALEQNDERRSRPEEPIIARRRYAPSKEFLAYDGDSCFVVTSREADRAFSARFWDDAAKLYRAAKSCRDADQSERALMSSRISACRDAAEDELRQKEQAAIRAARHAIANNAADDAQDNLRNFNRTLAYRLADFSNEYIAPEDNPRCIQALLDAWYYRPIAPSDGKSVFQVPLCYQIAGNLPPGTEIRHLSRNNKGKIYAFSPNQNMLWSWDARSFEPQEPIRLAERYNSYEASPDGETLVFVKEKQYLFWRSPRQSVKVPALGSYAWCFNNTGDVFYYFDVEDQTINSIALKDMFVSRKSANKKPAPLKFFSNVGQELINFAIYRESCWLAYTDRVEIWKQAPNKSWSLTKTIVFGRLPQYTIKISLYPEKATAIVNGDSSFVFNLNAASDSVTVLNPELIVGGQLFASAEDGSLLASTKTNDADPDRLLVNTTSDGSALFSALINHNEWQEFPVATFSRDKSWLFSVSLDGTLFAWDLSSGESDWLYTIEEANALALTPDGQNLVVRKNRSWVLINSDTHRETKEILALKDREISVFALSNAWIAYQTNTDSFHLKSFISDQRFEFPVRLSNSKMPVVAFSPDETLIAYTDAAKSVTIRSLESGAVVATRTFDGEIRGIQLFPGSEDAVVIIGNEDPVSRNVRTIAKIWRFVQQDAKLRVVRLHNYNISMMSVSPNGNRIAFSDGHDIRIFNLGDLSDETVRIYRKVHRDKEIGVSAFAFHPNGLVMAVGYGDGSVTMWDAENGTVLFKLQKTGIDDQFWVKSVAFIDNGRKIRQLNADLMMATRDLDPTAIRRLAQTNYRKLVPFTPEQIREYELENAMNYPGNFERLAESGEWPLIQAFFQYYYQQANRSNNISEVTRYSERAFILYQQLDPRTQKTLRGTMLEIYRDLHWKWILRGRVGEAAALVNHINQYFDRPFVAIEADAYTDLLAGNLQAAAKSFTEWSVLAYRNRPADGLNAWPAMDTLQNKVRQMAEYDLLAPSQRAFICGMFGSITDLNSICPEAGSLSNVPFDSETKAQWNILLNRVKATRTNNLGRRDKLLQQALESARAQYRQNPQKGRITLQELIYEIAQNDYARGVFEQTSKEALPFFRKSIALLQDSRSNQVQAVDSSRLYLLTLNYLSIGRLLLQQDHLNDGILEIELGLKQAELYSKSMVDTLSDNGSAFSLLNMLYEQLGIGRTLQGNSVAALEAYQNADRYQQYNYYSSAEQRAINIGHADLMGSDTIGALLQYGSIQDEQQLGAALAMMDRLGNKNPDKKSLFLGMMPRVKAGILAGTSLDTNVVHYWFARSKYEMFIYQSKWDSTLYWSEQAMKYVTMALDTSEKGYSVKENWLREHVNLSFYLIMAQGKKPEALGKAIQLSEAALHFVQTAYSTYPLRELLKTNLAHAYWLRNQPGDRAKSIQYYQEYLQSIPDYGKDNWETLEKDFRDFSNAGIQFPDFPALMEAIKPDGE